MAQLQGLSLVPLLLDALWNILEAIELNEYKRDQDSSQKWPPNQLRTQNQFINLQIHKGARANRLALNPRQLVELAHPLHVRRYGVVYEGPTVSQQG